MISLDQPQLVQVGQWRFTDHNRGPLDISFEQIESSNRMVDATLRKQFVAVKRTFSTSWENLPGPQWATVDGYLGADDMKAYYANNSGIVQTLKLQYGQQFHGDSDVLDTTVESVQVFFSDFSATISKRGWATSPTGQRVPMTLYSVSVSMVEV